MLPLLNPISELSRCSAWLPGAPCSPALSPTQHVQTFDTASLPVISERTLILPQIGASFSQDGSVVPVALTQPAKPLLVAISCVRETVPDDRCQDWEVSEGWSQAIVC